MDNREGTNPDPLTPRPADGGQPSEPHFQSHIPRGPATVGDLANAAGDEDDTPQTFGGWLAANAFSLVVVGAVIGLILYNFDLEGQWAILKAALGLSFVIFIHELGHFAVAKWCDVHVTTFSIGFGPPVPGCAWKWGETTYKLALFPLGGYVQMVGQVDGDEASDGSEEDPRSYRNKSVGQRMAIISAGVIMNVILAVLCFIVVYMIPGKDRSAAVVGTVDSGSPAFREGIRTGAAITQIGDIPNPTFEDLMIWVMATQSGEKVRFVSKQGDAPPQEMFIEPRLTADDQRPVIGISSPARPQLATKRYVGRTYPTPAIPGSAAAAATPPFEFGDRIIATTDPENPDQVIDLPDDPRAPGPQKDYFVLLKRLQKLAGKEITVRVERGGPDEPTETVDIKVPPSYRRSLGVRMQMGPIANVREGSAAARLVQGPDPTNQRGADLIEGVEVKGPDGEAIVYREKPDKGQLPLDPERLPHQLRQWADRMAQAEVKGPWPVTLTLRRHRDLAGRQYESVPITLDWDNAWRYDRVVPMNDNSPLAIPELGLAYQVKTMVAGVEPGSPLAVGDVVTNLRADVVGPDGEEIKGAWIAKEGLKPDQWAKPAYDFLQSPANITKIVLKVERAKQGDEKEKRVEEVEIVPTADKTWPLAERGWVLAPDMRRQKADTIGGAIALGLKDTHNNMLQVFQNLRGMLTLRVSPKLLGGPLTIAKAAYTIAGVDVWEFIFFLGLISVNLAVVNFLPIPVLDGGHMVFLLYEKLRGRPASETVRVGATYAGLALILGLMMFVLYLDFTRLFL